MSKWSSYFHANRIESGVIVRRHPDWENASISCAYVLSYDAISWFMIDMIGYSLLWEVLGSRLSILSSTRNQVEQACSYHCSMPSASVPPSVSFPAWDFTFTFLRNGQLPRIIKWNTLLCPSFLCPWCYIIAIEIHTQTQRILQTTFIMKSGTKDW